VKIFGYTFAQVRKAVIAFVTPGFAVLIVALGSASPGGSSVTSGEIGEILTAMFVTGGLVFGVGNARKPVAPADAGQPTAKTSDPVPPSQPFQEDPPGDWNVPTGTQGPPAA
jgi:hypothetical protein